MLHRRYTGAIYLPNKTLVLPKNVLFGNIEAKKKNDGGEQPAYNMHDW